MSPFLISATRRVGPAAIAAAISLLLGCSGDSSVTDPTGNTVATVQIDGQTTAIELTALGSTVTLTAKAMNADNQAVSGVTFTWTSSDQTVASVNGNGMVTALKNGTATISATAQGKSGTRSIKVTQAAASVVISPSPIPAMETGDSVQVSASVRDAGGAVIPGAVVAWSVAPEGAGTFSATNSATTWFKAGSSGNAVLTASSSGKSGAAPVAISSQSVSSVTIQGSGNVQLASLNETATLSAEARNAQGEVMNGVIFTWNSSDGSVASVSSTGVVTALKNGTTTITATADGKSGARAVVVSQVVSSLTMSPTPIPGMQVGDSVQLTATVRDAGGSAILGASVAWTVVPASAGTFSAASAATTLFRASGVGNATVTAASGGKTVAAGVTIAAPGVQTVTIAGTGAVQFTSLNQSTTLTAEARNAQGQVMSGVTFTWASSDQSVATVTGAGVVTAKKNGNATITASAGGKSGTRAVVVSQVAATLTISPATLPDMNVGDSVQVTAIVKDAGGSEITGATVVWSVSPTNAGNFSSSSAKAPWFKASTAANATITVTSGGKAATVTVKVNSSSSGSSGSLAFAYSGSKTGNFSATGTPIWDSSGFLYGTYAGALYDAQGYDEYTLGGFIAKGNNKADGFMITLIGVTGARSGIPICSGVYDQCPSNPPAATLGAIMFLGEWTSDGLESSDPNAAWLMTSGTVNVTEVTATRIKGNFSGIAKRAIDGAGSMTITNGTFDLPIVN